jgi:hypothetical protein
MSVRRLLSIAVFLASSCACHLTNATQADETTITIADKIPGPTPFIYQLSLLASNTSVIKSIRFTFDLE